MERNYVTVTLCIGLFTSRELHFALFVHMIIWRYKLSLSPDNDPRITDGRSNLTRGRIAAARRSFIVFSTWRQCAHNAWFLDSHDSASQTASESVHPFLHGSRSWPTDGHQQTEADIPRYVQTYVTDRPHLTIAAVLPNIKKNKNNAEMSS